MYTFIVVYPYARQFKNYIMDNFDVVSRHKNVPFTTREMVVLYSQGGYSRTFAKEKIHTNTAEGSKPNASSVRKSRIARRSSSAMTVTCSTRSTPHRRSSRC